MAITVQMYSKPFQTFNLLSASPTKWSNTLKQFVSKLPKLALKGLR